MKIALRALTVLLVLCSAVVAVLVFRPGQREPISAPLAVATAPALGQFIVLDPKLPAPALAFAARSGEMKQLADFRGHTLLVNLWATWCVPCVEELPALDRLQAKLGDDLVILAISEDRRGAEVVEPFLAQHGIEHLAIYLDPKSAASNEFGVEGLPTSFVIDRDGMIRGKLEGAAKWDEGPMLAILANYVGR